MLSRISVMLLSAFLLYSCKQEKSYAASEKTIAYDIFPVIGQSNVYYGSGLDGRLDVSDNRIRQLGRFGQNNYQIILAKDPLEHHSLAAGCNGFAMSFARNYLTHYWESDRQVLLIPAALSGSCFRNYDWRKGDTLYNDVVQRTRYVLNKYPGSEVKAFLWHQGEGDVYWGRYYAVLLDKMIINMRRDICGPKGDSIPFILGGMVPYWVDQNRERRVTDSVISETTARVLFTGYASARKPFVIQKPDNTVNDVHFDAGGQRILGRRYFEIYQSMRP